MIKLNTLRTMTAPVRPAIGAGSVLDAFRGPLPYARLMPAGGVPVETAGPWIEAGCVALGVGGELTSGAATGDVDAVTATARQLLAAVSNARGV